MKNISIIQHMTEIKYELMETIITAMPLNLSVALNHNYEQAYVNYLLGKGGYVFDSIGLPACLSVCLSVSNIINKVMNGLQ